MDLDETLSILKKHGVAAAELDEHGGLRRVTFLPTFGAADGDGDSDAAGPWRSAMQTAAGVLQGRQRSMREEQADA